MTAQAGQDVLIKIDMNGSGSFETLAGLRATKISFNTQLVDATHRDSPGRWRELLGGAGLRQASLHGQGVFIDANTDARAQAIFWEGRVNKMQAIIPAFGVIEGPFQITSLEYSGDYDGEAHFEIGFASAGALSFTDMESFT